MRYIYLTNKNSWTAENSSTVENYAPVTIPWDQWQQYVASGQNTILGAGGVIPGGTEIDGSVISGPVNQGYGPRNLYFVK